MKKLTMIMALTLSAGSAFAGDFEQAQNAGFDSTKGTAALIAFAVLVVATVVFFLWKRFRKTRVPIATVTTAIAGLLPLPAGDFERAREYGYGNDWRSGSLVSGINAAGRANSAVYNYVQANPMQALGYVHAFGDTSSTSRITSAAMIDSGRNTGGGDLTTYRINGFGNNGFSGGGIATGSLSGAGGYHYSTVCQY